MAGTETIIPAALLQLASDLQANVAPLIAQAGQSFTAADIDGGSFSTAGLPMQLAYPGIHEWAMRDTQTKTTELTAVHDNLVSTANTWAGAESNNVITIEV